MKLKSKICPHCGKLFTPKTPTQKYHSPKCRKNEHGSRKSYFPRFGEDASFRNVFRTEKQVIKQLSKEVNQCQQTRGQ